MTTLQLADLRQFTGDDLRYRHTLNRRVLYTPGIQYLAEQGGAYWLVDDIAILIGSPEFTQAAARDARIGQMHFWTLTVNADRSARLEARADSPDQPFITSRIEWTDFPLDGIDVWAALDGKHWTVYLPSEH